MRKSISVPGFEFEIWHKQLLSLCSILNPRHSPVFGMYRYVAGTQQRQFDHFIDRTYDRRPSERHGPDSVPAADELMPHTTVASRLFVLVECPPGTAEGARLVDLDRDALQWVILVRVLV